MSCCLWGPMTKKEVRIWLCVWKLGSGSDIILPFKWQQLLAALLEQSDVLFSVAGWLTHEQQTPNARGQRSHLTTAEPGTALSAFSTSASSRSCMLAAVWQQKLILYIWSQEKKPPADQWAANAVRDYEEHKVCFIKVTSQATRRTQGGSSN